MRFYVRSGLIKVVVEIQPIADGTNQRGTALPIPRVVVSRDLHISPPFTPTSFYRDAGTALVTLNHMLNLHVAKTLNKFIQLIVTVFAAV